jgi:hypothetical protein
LLASRDPAIAGHGLGGTGFHDNKSKPFLSGCHYPDFRGFDGLQRYQIRWNPICQETPEAIPQAKSSPAKAGIWAAG